MEFLRKYGTATAAATHVTIPVIKAGSNDFALSADWTPAAGDVKISKDGGAAANIATLPTFLTSIGWVFQFSAAELQCARLNVTITDSATKAVEDQAFSIITFGHASAMLVVDFSDVVRMGLTALPNAAAQASGGLFTRGTGAGQINQDGNGRIDTNLAAISGDATSADVLEEMYKNLPTFTIASGGSSTELRTNRTEADNYWTDSGGSAVLMIKSSTPAGAAFFRKATAYANTNGAFTVEAMPITPTAGTGIILGRIE